MTQKQTSNTAIGIYSLRICLGLVAISGNFFIIFCVTWSRSLRNPTNIVIANLAAVDFVSGVSMLLHALFNFTSCTGVLNISTTLWIVQKSLRFLGFLNNNIAVFYIALERFANIKLALRYHNIVTNERVLIGITSTWIGSAVTAILVMTFSATRAVTTLNLLCSIGAIGTVSLYGYVCYVAYMKSKQIIPQQIIDGRTAEIQDHQKVQWKITKFLAIVLGVYFASYFPWFLLTIFVKQQLNDCVKSGILGIIVMITWGLNICVDPFIYVWKSEQFGKCMKKMFGMNNTENSGT